MDVVKTKIAALRWYSRCNIVKKEKDQHLLLNFLLTLTNYSSITC